ncbi:MipA/OmpV family protein [Cysteiniphilum sp. QT6929]|uniref:MipA/OmpV family protein n=1 Tax=Cysteiniphilum sp. QT6929 TaxID=2975055 RepID=UPI0024B33B62|nr:MipA/OmpV family protein [Cysteiniphilum sp. QT6929]WHN65300.1 MipA/OmpV family protein [Cysteiniphilum sp. QT6929]
MMNILNVRLKLLFKSSLIIFGGVYMIKAYAYDESKPDSAVAIESLQSDPIQYQDNKKLWAVGVGSLFSPNPYKATKDSYLFFPMINYKGEDLSIVGPYIGYKVIKNKFASLSVEGFLYPQTFDPANSDNTQLSQLNKRHYMFMGGISGQITTPYGRLQLGLNTDLTVGTHGWIANVHYTKPLIFEHGKHDFVIIPGAGVMWTQDKILDYYYGVSASESLTSGLPEYTVKSAFSPYISLSLIYRYNKNWSVGSAFQINQLSTTVKHSPMVGEWYVFTSALSLTYSFG